RLGAASTLEIGARTLNTGVDWTPHGGSRGGEVRGPVTFVDETWSGDLRDTLVVGPPHGSRLQSLILARQRGAAAVLLIAAALPLAQTVAMLNFDMVGRMRGGTLTIGGVDSADRLRAATADAARRVGVNVDLRGSPFSPSDHTRFYAAGTPVLFFHTGGHDDYHRPGDTPDRL